MKVASLALAGVLELLAHANAEAALGPLGEPWGEASPPKHAQIPFRAGDCVQATADLHYFDGSKSEYDGEQVVKEGSLGQLVGIGNDNGPATVDWSRTNQGVTAGATWLSQIKRILPKQVTIAAEFGWKEKCLTITESGNGYYVPAVTLQACEKGNKSQVFLSAPSQYREHCGSRPFRWAGDPSKCIDVVHRETTLLSDCSGKDSQSFMVRDGNIIGYGGRLDMCYGLKPKSKDRLALQNCNYPTLLKFNIRVVEERV